MTNSELNERIEAIENAPVAEWLHLSADCPIRQLIRDCIEAVTPEHREWDTTEPYDNPDIAQGHNEALDTIKQNTDSLLNPPTPQTPHTDA